jgi:hypothetical protein
MKDTRKTKGQLKVECYRLTLDLIRNLRYNEDAILKKELINLKQQLSKIPVLGQKARTYFIDLNKDCGGNGTIENPFGYLELTNKRLKGKLLIKRNKKICQKKFLNT